MASFETYLQKEGFKPETVYQHCKYASYFLAWTAEASLALEQITYTEILDFADHLKQDNKGINLIRAELTNGSFTSTIRNCYMHRVSNINSCCIGNQLPVNNI